MNRYMAAIQRLILDRPERRSSRRYQAVPNQACVFWNDGDQVQHSTSQMHDISQGGTLVTTERVLPTDRSVWVRLEAPRATEWAEAMVVRKPRSHKAGLQFTQGCPYELFKVATHGNLLGGASVEFKTPTFDALTRR